MEGKVICANCFRNIPISIRNQNDILSIYSYRHSLVNKLLWKLKYNHSQDVAKMFGKILGQMLIPIILEKKFLFEKIVFVPIPLNIGDKRMHNHAEILANEICDFLNKNITKHCEVKSIFIKSTSKKQAHIKIKQERLNNIKNTFSINPHEASSLSANNLYIIVDDITTTGATMYEAKTVLGKNTDLKIISVAIAH